jgi:hypothetical protein
MNADLISLVLSLLSSVQVAPGKDPAPKIEAVYVEWATADTVTFPCADPSSGIDPMGQTVILVRSRSQCDQSGCQSVSTLDPVTVYPDTKSCRRGVRMIHHKIFESKVAAGQFRLDCPASQCQDWKARDATDEEVVSWALALRKWKIFRYPGGDMYSYPDGVFEVFPDNELNFNEPLSQGKSALEAVAKALKDHPDSKS